MFKDKFRILSAILLFLLLLLAFSEATPSAEKRGTGLGEIAPNISGTDILGKKHSLEELRGNFVLVIFWAIDCPACSVELARYQAYYKKSSPKDFKILSILINNRLPNEKIIEHTKKEGYTFPVIPLSVENTRTVSATWNVLETPTSLLINPKGVVVLRGLFGEEGLAILRKVVEKNKSFLPPKIELKPKTSPMGEILQFQLTLADVKPGTLHLILKANMRYIKPSGELGSSEEVVPLKVEISQEQGAVIKIEAKLLDKGIDGIKAKLTSREATVIKSKVIGKTGLVEVTVPVTYPQTQIVTSGKIYSDSLKSYIPIGGGFPTVMSRGR